MPAPMFKLVPKRLLGSHCCQWYSWRDHFLSYADVVLVPEIQQEKLAIGHQQLIIDHDQHDNHLEHWCSDKVLALTYMWCQPVSFCQMSNPCSLIASVVELPLWLVDETLVMHCNGTKGTVHEALPWYSTLSLIVLQYTWPPFLEPHNLDTHPGTTWPAHV